VTAEALCCGLPVIASNVGGIKELITDAEYGLLVNNELSEWVNALTHFDADKYSRDNIKTYFQKRYSSETVGYLYSHILND
jgi:glycosyltransferase involved in cell wall biosynthesis